MATPRKRWLRIADKLGFETLTNDELATWIRVLAYLNTRWARDGRTRAEAGQVVATRGLLVLLTDCGSVARALRVLDKLAARGWLTLDEHGDDWLICVANFAEFQALPSESRENPGQTSAHELPPPRPASRVPPPRPAEEEESEIAPSGALATAPRDRGRQTVRDAWPALQLAARQHGAEWKVLSDARLMTISARVSEGAGPADLLRAIHGAVAYWKRLRDFDVLANLKPETVFRKSNFQKYLEAPLGAPKGPSGGGPRTPPPYRPPVTEAEAAELKQRQLEMAIKKNVIDLADRVAMRMPG